MGRLLLVDDEPVLREVLGTLLRRNGYQVIEAETAKDALLAFTDEEIELVLLDLMLPDGNGLDVLKEIRSKSPDTVVVIITAYSSIEGAIEAMREGAFHYIPKPFKNQEVLLTVRRGLEQRTLRAENLALKSELDALYGLGNLIGRSEPMRKVFELIRLAAPSASPVLVEGEPGTGKELVARTIHHHSRRARRPFVIVATEGVDPDVLIATLVGSSRGGKTLPGLIETAHGGTLYLDGVDTLPRPAQELLSRALRSGEYRPGDGGAARRFDVRLVAGTDRDLGALVAKKTFAKELAEQIQGVTISLPPLRKRREDIPLLVRYFLERAGGDNGSSPSAGTDAMRILLEAPWPGNVRELEEVVARAVAVAPNGKIAPQHLPVELVGEPRAAMPASSLAPPPLPADGMSLKDAVQEYERQMIMRALTLSGGVQKRAAEILRVKPTTLNEMIKRLGLQETA